MIAWRWICVSVLARVCCGQQPVTSFEIDFDRDIQPEKAIVRYAIAGDDFGGWLKTQPELWSYRIDVAGRQTSSLRAIFYSPGCQIQTLDTSLGGGNLSHVFHCVPAGTVSMRGQLRSSRSIVGQNVLIRPKYIARWASGFLGIAAEAPLALALADGSPLSSDGSFQVRIPDLAHDPHAGSQAGTGELQLWAIDESTGLQLAHLLPSSDTATADRTGSLKIRATWPNTMVFDFCSIGNVGAHLIRRDGFAIRGDDPRESCAH